MAEGAGILIVGAAVGLGGKLIRTVSFFGWILPDSPGLGPDGAAAAGAAAGLAAAGTAGVGGLGAAGGFGGFTPPPGGTFGVSSAIKF